MAGVAAVLVLAAGLPGRAQVPSSRLLVLDQDAHDTSAVNAGALFNVDLAAATSAAPGVEIAADGGAPQWEFLSGLTLSPFDSKVYVTDLGLSPRGAVEAFMAGSGAMELITDDPGLADPFALAFLPDGRLVIVDWDADPSGLGADSFGGTGHGALFTVDPANCARPCPLTLLSDGTDHPPMPGLGSASAFEDPVGVAYDSVRDVLYVADLSADPLGLNYAGALYRVDPATGAVELVSSGSDFLSLTSVAVRPTGEVIVVDGVQADSVVWSVDPSDTDPEGNYVGLTGGVQYALVEGAAVDAANRVFVVDSGEYDPVSGQFIVPPGVFRVDETNPSPGNNAVLVNDSIELVTPVAVVAVPVPVSSDVTPSIISAATVVRVDGQDLTPQVDYDFGPAIVVSGVSPVTGTPIGTAMQMTLTPPGGPVIVPPGCAGGGPADLVTTHPFGGASTLAPAITVGDTGGIVPGVPCSPFGDGTCDGVVDGLDLAVLGRHYSTAYCDGFAFLNDADFNNDDLIDGRDLAVLATFYGTRP